MHPMKQAPLQGLIILFILLSLSFVHANENIDINRLAENPTWLKLLHYNQEHESEILDHTFFLSEDGKKDPKKELQALIESYQVPWSKDPNLHPRCRFPARYYWLSQNIQLSNYEVVPSKCTKLNNWALFNKVKSISLLLVSGYLGNPASTFGHALLKLNSSEVEDNLFDLSINYGALIPENEPTWRYVLNGLTGGYVAGYSDRYFYNQDMTYTHTEFRDIWNYHLQLTQKEKTLLILHLWEIAGKKSQYYFLTKNCAYAIGKLLEVVIDKPLTDSANFWYAPVELFSHLEEIHFQRVLHGYTPLILNIQYIPSSQRFLVAQYNMLDEEMKSVAKDLLQEKNDIDLKKFLMGKTSLQKQQLLDFALAYQQYRYIKEQPNPTFLTLSLKNKILLERLQLPPSKPTRYQIKELLSPTKGQKPLVFSIGIENRGLLEEYIVFNTIIFSQESTGKNSLDGDELTFFDISLGVNRKIFLDQIDYVRIRKLTTNTISIDTTEKWSWNLKLSTIKDERKEHFGKYDHSIIFGTGKAMSFSESKGYAILDFSTHTLYPYFRIKPKLGFITELNSQSKILISYGIENFNDFKKYEHSINMNYQYVVSPSLSFLVKYQYKNSHQGTIQLRTHW